jgi:DNA-binding NarL/FixJ family response regulator
MGVNSSENEGNKHKVFLVDDHPIVREGLAQLINKETDLTVCGEAGDVSDALQAISESKPDIAIIDLTLEHGSGLRLIENLHYKKTGVPILVLSMHDESVYAERCLKAGAKGYIMKQEPSDRMLSAIRKVLDGEMYISGNMEKKFLSKMISGDKIEFTSPVDVLSNRELEVYQLFGQGLKKREIADQLNLSVKTIETYVENIKKKMNFSSSHEITMHAIRFFNESMK